MPPKWNALEERRHIVDVQKRRARRSLRLWRGVFWTTGIAAVAFAALAGGAGLGDLWGAKVAGILALTAAVLAAVDKFLTAGDKVAQLQQRDNDLNKLQCKLESAVVDARLREDGTAVRDEYVEWLCAKCTEVDEELSKINTEHGEL